MEHRVEYYVLCEWPLPLSTKGWDEHQEINQIEAVLSSGWDIRVNLIHHLMYTVFRARRVTFLS